MNVTLLFGIVLGLLLAILFFFALIVWVCRSIADDNKKRWDETQSYNKITTDLMRERNVIDAETKAHVALIAKAALLYAGPHQKGLSSNDPWGWLRTWLRHYDESTGSGEGQKIHDWILKQPTSKG